MSTTPGSNDQWSNTILLLLALGAGFLFVCSGMILAAAFLLHDAGRSSQKMAEETGGKSGPPSTAADKGPNSPRQTPLVAAQAFLEDLKKARVDEAYAKTAPSYQSQVSRQEFSRLIEQNPSFISYQTCTWNTTPGMDPFTFEGKISGGPHASAAFTLEVSPAGKGYEISKFTIH